MADIVTFDPANLRIIEIDSGQSTNTLDLVEIYSEWKDWKRNTPQHMGYPPAFRVVGGDPISDTQNLGSTFFLNTGDGWKIRPAEYDHQLEIVGNIFTDPAGENPYAPTAGPYTVTITNRVSNLTDASVARLDLLALLDSVYIDTDNGVAGTEGDVGTPTNPVNNIADARVIADTNNVNSYTISGSVTLDQDYMNWEFIGGPGSTSITLGGFDVTGCDFSETSLVGAGTGSIDAHSCMLWSLSGVSGIFQACSLADTFVAADNDFHALVNCVSGVPGSGRPTITFGVNTQMAIRNYSGGIELTDVTTGCVASCDMDPGDVRLLASCTGGEVLCRGVGILDDQSTGTTVVNRMVSNTLDPQGVADAVWKADISQYDSLITEMGGKILAELDALINAGGSLTPGQADSLREIWQILGLDSANPLVVAPTSRVAGSVITQSIDENVPTAGSVTITKN